MSYVSVSVCEGLWGGWGQDVTVPDGCYINGVRVRYEAPIGSGDDTAMNGIQIHYVSFPDSSNSISHYTTVHPGHWGDWRNWVYAPHGFYVAGFRARFEPSQRDGDDTGLNGIEMICMHFRTHQIQRVMVEPGNWGEWGPDAVAPFGWCAIGMQARVEGPQGDGDDTAMNGIRMLCRPIGQ